MDVGHEEKILAQNLLSAARRRDVLAVKNLLKNVSANVQDASTGSTPLHAVMKGDGEITDSSAVPSMSENEEESIVNLVQVLFENGAIWNDLDKNGETPGCIAWRLGYKQPYQLIVNAGVRAELLLSKLDEIESEGEEAEVTTEAQRDASRPNADVDAVSTNGVSGRALGTEAAVTGEPPEDYIDHWDSNADFLRSTLRYTNSQLLDSSSNAVMMDWETEIMRRHAERILPTSGLRAMNIGHGMGIVDAAIQTHKPSEHHIVEAHPGVLQQMRKNGWYDKPGVKIHEGRWQDVLPNLLREGVVLDGIYYDTFAEDYKDLRELFTEHVIGLLDQEGRFGFYNGLGADRRVSYDVYTNVWSSLSILCSS